jgi:multiple sugar transport system permease protein
MFRNKGLNHQFFGRLRKPGILVGLYIFIALNLIWTLFPIYWTFLTSFKTIQQMNTMPPLFIFTPTLANYIKLLSGDALLTFRNSLLISVASVFVGLLVGFPAAYTLARISFRGKNQANFYILSMRIAPVFAFLIPYYLTFRYLNLLDSFVSMIIVYSTITIPFTVWMLQSMIADLPEEIEEAALVDGCTPVGVMWHIVAPMLAPGIAAAAILAFVFSWNEFFFALILTGEHTRTVPVMLISLIGLMGVDWVKMSAAGILAIIPTIVLALLAQKYLVRGLTLGAIKA